jgi:hypothetical protein
LPSHAIIKFRFGVNLKKFLEIYYPTNKLCNSRLFFDKIKEDFKKDFIKRYNKIQPNSAEEYNKKRGDGIPSRQTVSIMFDIRKWIDWLKFCELEKYYVKNIRCKTSDIRIISYLDYGKIKQY